MYLCRNLSSINWLPLKLACDCKCRLAFDPCDELGVRLAGLSNGQ